MASNLMRVECEGGEYYIAEDVRVHPSSIIGPGTRLWEGVKVGPGSSIGHNCVIGAGVHIEGAVLGSYSKVQRGVTLYDGVVTEDYVFFGPNATTTNDRNPRAFGPWDRAETVIEIGASIGANATLIAGRRIGALSLIAAGAVVSRDVEPGQVVLGNPAQFGGWLDIEGRVISRVQADVPEPTRQMLENPKLAIEELLQKSQTSSKERIT